MCRALLIDEEAPHDDELLANKADYVGQEGVLPLIFLPSQMRRALHGSKLDLPGLRRALPPSTRTDWDNTKRRR